MKLNLSDSSKIYFLDSTKFQGYRRGTERIQGGHNIIAVVVVDVVVVVVAVMVVVAAALVVVVVV